MQEDTCCSSVAPPSESSTISNRKLPRVVSTDGRDDPAGLCRADRPPIGHRTHQCGCESHHEDPADVSSDRHIGDRVHLAAARDDVAQRLPGICPMPAGTRDASGRAFDLGSRGRVSGGRAQPRLGLPINGALRLGRSVSFTHRRRCRIHLACHVQLRRLEIPVRRTLHDAPVAIES